jgi:hypothetical protein
MQIDRSGVEAAFWFKASEYVLVHDEHRQTHGFELVLCPRIDRSYKGKDDDVGSPVLFLSDEEAEQLKKEGFAWTVK